MKRQGMLPGGYSFRELTNRRIIFPEHNLEGVLICVTPESYLYVKMSSGENIYVDPLTTKYEIKEDIFLYNINKTSEEEIINCESEPIENTVIEEKITIPVTSNKSFNFGFFLVVFLVILTILSKILLQK